MLWLQRQMFLFCSKLIGRWESTQESRILLAMRPNLTFLWMIFGMKMDVRKVARVLVINDFGQTYLLRGRDTTLPDPTPFWFTPGGKIDPGETPAQAASRELFEELGLVATPEQLGDAIGTESSDYYFEGQAYRQNGVFFAFLSNNAALNTLHWSEIEARTIDQGKWWSVRELETTTETIYPAHLVQMLADYLTVPDC
jgi:8-oxo-dGTP pyrophosphatase MutT (NUDIX family)